MKLHRMHVGTLLVAALAACSCKTTSEMPRNDLVNTLKDAGWTPLALPDSSYQPGTIVKIDSQTKTVDYLGTLNPALCNIPPQYLNAKPASSGQIFTQESYAAGIGLAAAIKGVSVSAGAGANIISFIKIDDQGAQNLDVATLSMWLSGNRNTVNQSCLQWLQQPDIYLINRAFAINKGIVGFKQQAGGDLEAVSPQIIKQIVNVGANAGASWNANGELVINQPTFIAIRGIRNLSGNLEILGDDKPEADSAAKQAIDVLQSQGEKELRAPN